MEASAVIGGHAGGRRIPARRPTVAADVVIWPAGTTSCLLLVMKGSGVRVPASALANPRQARHCTRQGWPTASLDAGAARCSTCVCCSADIGDAGGHDFSAVDLVGQMLLGG